MFGPNTHLSTQISILGSHRDPSFRKELGTLRREFAERFSLEDFEIAFLLGGGSLGVEALFYSLRPKVEVAGVEGTFTVRWRALADLYAGRDDVHTDSDPVEKFYCQLETSLSEFQYFPNGFVDAVSSFPYRAIPADARGFVTSSNKVLGSLVGLAIVGIRKEICEQVLRPEDTSYLSLRRYFRFLKEDQTPSTTSTHNIEHLLSRIRNFDIDETVNRIDAVSDLLVNALGSENLVGSHRGPVLTVRQDRIPAEIAEKWTLYGKPSNGGVYQIFTYSCPFEEYEAFAREIEGRN